MLDVAYAVEVPGVGETAQVTVVEDGVRVEVRVVVGELSLLL